MSPRDEEELRHRISQAKDELAFQERKLKDLTTMLGEQEAFMKKWEERLAGSNAWMPTKTATLWLKDEQLAALSSRNTAGFRLNALTAHLSDGEAPLMTPVGVGPGPMPR